MKTTFRGRFKLNGGFEFGPENLRQLKIFIKKNPGMVFEIVPLLPESKDQRGWFEGGLVPLVAFYQTGMDHHNNEDLRKVREWLKIEFNGDLVVLGGKSVKVGKTTKKKLNLGFLERCTDWLIENYAPPIEAMDPKKYQDWKDRIYPQGGPTDYLDYLVKINILSTPIEKVHNSVEKVHE